MSSTRLVVEVCHASNLLPRDGEGSASPFVEVEFDGQRHRTQARIKDLNPAWNEKLHFVVSDPSSLQDQPAQVHVYTQKRNHRYSLGMATIPAADFKRKGAESVSPYRLHGRWLFSPARGEIFLKSYHYEDFPAAPKEGKSSDEGKKESGSSGGKKEEQQPKKVAAEQKNPPASLPQQKAAASQDTKAETKVAPAAVSRFYSVSEAVNYNVQPTSPNLEWEKVTHDLVTPMEYLFVRVVKARDLAARDVTGSSDPYVEVKVGNKTARTRVVSQSLNPDWDQVFAFELEMIHTGFLEVNVWDKDMVKDDFLGYLSFEIAETPSRRPPDSPLAPQWYRLEPKRNEKRVKGDIMLSVWIGTQADEAFSVAWQSDSGGHPHTRSKVYLSPKLWYLRLHVIEAQDLVPLKENRFPQVFVQAELGFQSQRTKIAGSRSTSPVWGEDLLFVAAEPFEEHLMVVVLDRVAGDKDEVLGCVRIPLSVIQKRADHRQVHPRWYELEEKKKAENGDQMGAKKEKERVFSSRIHLRVSLDGGYHVLDESVHHSSDMRPTDKRRWKPPIGLLELGILGSSSLLPMKAREGRSCTDAYCVAKYGPKWIKTRTVVDSFNPKWNEQYTWEVYDPCTVLTVGVFDNHQVPNGWTEKSQGLRDQIIGKVRIRLSTLETDRIYTHSYPLIALDKSGVKKKGDVELAVRFSCSSWLGMMLAYVQPLLPKMHYLHPFHPWQQEQLRSAAMKIVVLRLARSEPPIRPEVVQYMLDVDSYLWSLRRSKANWYRLQSVFSGAGAAIRWFSGVCKWRNPATTVLVHALYLTLVWFPGLILPTICLYMFLIGVWQYRFRDRHPPHMDVALSCADAAEPGDLDEEFDAIPTSRGHDVVRARYDRMRLLAGRLQTVAGDAATQLERFHALLSWRDPRASAAFVCLCLAAAVVLYATPFQVVATVAGVYALRHPRFRTGLPSLPMNFFRRLPALSDRML